MITKISPENAGLYKSLFEDVTKLLQTHDLDGNPIAVSGDQPAIDYEPVKFDDQDMLDAFEGNLYYRILNSDTGAYEYNQIRKTPTYSTYIELDPVTGFYTIDIGEDEEPIIVDEVFELGVIDSLESLYGHMADIAMINPKYTRLPLDEPNFIVNLNTRQIEDHKDFNKNGLGVEGDELAEIVYFEVDRYYDSTDLYGTAKNKDGYASNPMEIFIEWSCKKKEVNKETGETKIVDSTGVSVPWLIDAESKKGKIIFGWPITSELTSVAGPITFAIRFYIFEDQKLKYSLSTLPYTKGTIKSTLNFAIEDIRIDPIRKNFVDKTLDIKNRFTNSLVDFDDDLQVEAPVFLYVKNNLADADNATIIDLGNESNDPYNYTVGETDVHAQATSSEGRISYYWKKSENLKYLRESKGQIIPRDLSISYTYNYIPTTDKKREAQKTYYYDMNQFAAASALVPKTPQYLVVPSSITTFNKTIVDSKDAITITLETGEYIVYERVSSATFDSIGNYQVVAINRIRSKGATTKYPAPEELENPEVNEFGEVINSVVENYIQVYGPGKPDIIKVQDKDLIENQTIAQDLNHAVPVYLKTNLNADDSIKNYSVTLTVDHDFAPTVEEAEKGSVIYEWQYLSPDQMDAEEQNWITIANVDENNIAIANINKFLINNAGQVDTDELGNTFIKGLAINEIHDEAGKVIGTYADKTGYYRVRAINQNNRYPKEWTAYGPEYCAYDANNEIIGAIATAESDYKFYRVTPQDVSYPHVSASGLVKDRSLQYNFKAETDPSEKQAAATVYLASNIAVVPERNDFRSFEPIAKTDIPVNQLEAGEYHAAVNSVNKSDGYTYQWYYYRPTVNEPEYNDDFFNAENGLSKDYDPARWDDIEITTNIESDGISSTLTFDKTSLTGKYYCVVTHYYNGLAKSIVSPFFDYTGYVEPAQTLND